MNFVAVVRVREDVTGVRERKSSLPEDLFGTHRESPRRESFSESEVSFGVPRMFDDIVLQMLP